MEKYRLSAEEVLFIYLLFLASSEENHPEYLKTYYNLPIDKSSLKTLLVSLQEKGVILKQYKIPAPGKQFDPEAVPFNQNFLRSYKKFSGELGAEFYEAYPKNGIVNGLEVPLNNWSKKFKTEEEFYFAYGKSIGWSEEQHKEVLSLIEWGKQNNCNLLNMNIADFAVSKIWRNISELKDGNSIMTFNPIQSI